MSLLQAHLEQISFSCQGIDSLPFPPPKMFTNAIVSNTDITNLLRDVEDHERALFSVPPPPPPQIPTTKRETDKAAAKSRRQTVFNVAQGEVTTGPPTTRSRPRQHTAVAAVLGGDLHSRIVRSGGSSNKGEVDLDILLYGAEKLYHVYPRHGALEQIAALRRKEAQQNDNQTYFEAKVAAQEEEARRRYHKDDYLFSEDEEDEEVAEGSDGMTEEELRREEEELRQLERRKRELQERLRSFERA